MARKKTRQPITKDHVISTLVYIRNLSDAHIATLMAGSAGEIGSMPPPLTMAKAYDKDCPPPGLAYAKDCPPPGQAYAKDCPPPNPVKTRFTNCPTYGVIVKEKVRKDPGPRKG